MEEKGGKGFFRVICAMEAFARRRKVRVKGRVKIEEKRVWESKRLRREKRGDDEGKDEAWNKERRREEMRWRVEGEEVRIA